MKFNLLVIKWYKTNIYKLVKHDHSLFSLTVSLTTSTQIRRIPNTYKVISSPTQTTPVRPSQAWWMDWITHSRHHQLKPKKEIQHTKTTIPIPRATIFIRGMHSESQKTMRTWIFVSTSAQALVQAHMQKAKFFKSIKGCRVFCS